MSTTTISCSSVLFVGSISPVAPLNMVRKVCGPNTAEEGWKVLVRINVVSAPAFIALRVALLLTAGGENCGDKLAITVAPAKGVFPSFLMFVLSVCGDPSADKKIPLLFILSFQFTATSVTGPGFAGGSNLRAFGIPMFGENISKYVPVECCNPKDPTFDCIQTSISLLFVSAASLSL